MTYQEAARVCRKEIAAIPSRSLVQGEAVMHRIAFAVLLSTFASVAIAGPRAGQIDPTFGQSQGITAHGIDLVENGTDVARAFAEDAQGRLYLAGSVEDGEGTWCLGLMRFSPNGELDKNYASGGKGCEPFPLPASVAEVSDIMVQDDGLLVVAGVLYDESPIRDPFVCRFTTSGTVDLSFNASETPGCHTMKVANGSEPSGQQIVSVASYIYVVATAVDEVSVSILPHIYRLAHDGSLAPFGDNDVVVPFAAQVGDVVIVQDSVKSSRNMLIISGMKNFAPMVAEFDPASGALNPGFGDKGVFAFELGSSVSALTIGKEGSIYAAGPHNVGGNTLPFVSKLDRDGSILPDFNGGEIAVFNPCVFMLGGCKITTSAIRVSVKGNVILGGQAEFNGSPFSMWAMRVRPDGKVDTDFGSTVLGQEGLARVNLSVDYDGAVGLVLQEERVVLGGTIAIGEGGVNQDFALVRLADGTIFRDGLEAIP